MDAASIIPIAKFVGIVWPTLYAGFTASDSLTFVEPIVNHAPNQKVMAKQWLYGYQYGPLWVPPLIAPATFANLYLSYLAHQHALSLQRNVYAAAAGLIFSILPITFFYMEPGINGASKWKVQTLLKDEGFQMKDTMIWYPSAHMHGSTQASRRWAEQTDMKDLILFWRRVNNVRWVIAGAAAGLSGWATLAFQ